MPDDDSTGSESRSVDSPNEDCADRLQSKPFKIKARKLGLPKEWTSGSISELLEMLEGPDYR